MTSFNVPGAVQQIFTLAAAAALADGAMAISDETFEAALAFYAAGHFPGMGQGGVDITRGLLTATQAFKAAVAPYAAAIDAAMTDALTGTGTGPDARE